MGDRLPGGMLDVLIGGIALPQPVTLFEGAGFAGRSIQLGIGEHPLDADFNDVAASIQVAPGHAAIVYEHADSAGGFGVSVDLLEDSPDLSTYGLSKKVSFVSVFASTDGRGFIWVRGKGEGASYFSGHWERPRASGESPNAPVGAPSPPLPSRAPMPSTTIEVSGSFFHITTLGPQDFADSSLWQHAVTNQLGVIGSDYRGSEAIGSAAFERGSNNRWIPDNINFWYPQKQPNDHRESPYFKRTCVGTAEAVVSDIEGTYRDQDVDIYITPDPLYQYLITEGHPREYTDIMAAQYSHGITGLGQHSCDDAASLEDFTFVEAEIQPSGDLDSGIAEGLRDRIAAAADNRIGVYGPWIYDKGHCCHAEIHPAEELWWREGGSPGTYHLNLICDASKRFWWRDQMDDGVKLKPWGAPPIGGVFAIAFEVAQPGPNVAAPLEFVASEVSRYNVEKMASDSETQLVHNGTTLARFVPNGDLLRASFERVGLAENGRIRGFLVLEASVGRLNQDLVTADFPAGTDVNAIDEDDERKVFDKQEGHFMFTVAMRVDDAPVVNPG